MRVQKVMHGRLVGKVNMLRVSGCLSRGPTTTAMDVPTNHHQWSPVCLMVSGRRRKERFGMEAGMLAKVSLNGEEHT